MQSRKIEYRIIKVSIVLACLIIALGLMQRLATGGTYATPASKVGTTTGQTANNSQQTTGPTVLPQGKVVAIGDSFTYGYPYDATASWVGIAGQALHRDFINAGKVSQSSADLLARFNSDVVSQKPSEVIITVGTGDALHAVPLANYQANIQQLIAQAKANNIVPILGLPLNYPDTSASKLISDYRSWLISYAPSADIKLIDFNKVLYDSTGLFLQNLSNDGKYPNKAGYQAMAQAVEQVFAPAN